jgi:hypothetical protein
LQLFYVTATPFFIFYGIFAFVLYPNRDLIHPEMPPAVLADERLKYSLSLLYNWSFSLFYIISELWGSVGVSVLFWQSELRRRVVACPLRHESDQALERPCNNFARPVSPFKGSVLCEYSR